jgi:hypothetical protein
MPAAFSEGASSGLPTSLRIRLAAGERPYLFWVSHWTQQPEGRCRYKILSKALPDRSLEVIVLQEGTRPRRQPIAQLQIPSDSPSGWLERWVETLAEELETRFERFDLRSIESVEEWRTLARRLGWTRSPETGTS